jgi:hypothetical protein
MCFVMAAHRLANEIGVKGKSGTSKQQLLVKEVNSDRKSEASQCNGG